MSLEGQQLDRYRILRLLGSGGMARCTWPKMPALSNRSPSR